MKAITLILLIAISERSFSQQIDKKFTFSEVGWTFTLPADFNIIDSADNAARMKRGAKIIEDANGVTANTSETRTLISAKKKEHNYFNATITPFNPEVDGEFDVVNKSLNEMAFKALQEKMGNLILDSFSIKIKIDGLLFDKFWVIANIKPGEQLNFHLLTKLHKGYLFGITYLYLDAETGEQIRLLLKDSKFEK